MKLFKILLALAITLFNLTAFAAEPENLSFDKQQLKQYYNSGQYIKDLTAVDIQAEQYLQQRVDENNKLPQPKKLAIVFDIDETCLSNYAHMLEYDFGGNPKIYASWTLQANDPAIKPTLELYQLARKDNVAVFFVTGRPESLRVETVENLRETGFTQWNGLILRPVSDHSASAIPYKSGARANIEKMGYDIALNIGDQASDLANGHADQTFKLPNPFYWLP